MKIVPTSNSQVDPKARNLFRNLRPLAFLFLACLGMWAVDPAAAAVVSIWPDTTTPVNVSADDPGAVEVGVKFQSDVDGTIHGIRFYKAENNTNTHIGSLWTSNGTSLATVIFTNETVSGWQEALFVPPVAIVSNTVYVASYHANNGHYSVDGGYFLGKGMDNPPLHALADGVFGGNGVFAYGASSTFPDQSYNAANYWVDVMFQYGSSPTLTSIAVTPANSNIVVGATQQFTATGTYSDGSTQDITSQATWTSSSPEVATINVGGLATAVSAGATTISAKLADVVGSTTLTIQSTPLVITMTLSPTGIVSVAYTATLTASGGTIPYTWSITSGTLPSGLTLHTNSGAITGTPTATGTFSFIVQVRDAGSPAQTVTQPLVITILPLLVITTTSLPNGVSYTIYSATLTAEGGTPAYTWSMISGTLPSGLTLYTNSGAITGTPSDTGTFSFTVQVRDTGSQTATKTLSITIAAMPAVVTIWPSSARPGREDDGPSSPVELGVKFKSDVAGTITGIRFYKAAANTGVHIGNLWSSTGTLVGTATFANETTSGWQQVLFATPVTIASNTVYVASYHAENGHYSEDDYYFQGKGVDNPPLHALTNGVAGGNGVYAYGTSSAFPNQTYNAANYWVDVLFQPLQSAPLVIPTISLPAGTVSVAYTATLTAGGGALPYTWSMISGTLPSGLMLHTNSGAISGTPSATGTFGFTVQVRDANSQTATKPLSITIAAMPAVATIWPSDAAPGEVDNGPDSAVELGVKFKSDMEGTIAGIRFYKSTANTGLHVGNLWMSNGVRLATVIFTNETASGWQEALFAKPVTIVSNAVYVTSYHANNGHYSEDENYFEGKGIDNPPLHALANGVAGGNGVYAYGTSNIFPNQTYHAANYWVDVVFLAGSTADEHFVNVSNSTPIWPYTHWTTAATNIQDAIDVAAAGDTVWVANGVYDTGGRTAGGQTMTNRVVIDKPLTVQSVNGPEVAIIQGQGPLGTDAVRCAYVTNGAKLVGFTLTNGFTDNRLGEFIVAVGQGGGIYCESVEGVASNCIFTGNSASYGGGACNGTLYNCILTWNSAYYGGGSFDCTLYNCTLAGNSGTWHGGGAFEGTLYNCILYYNTSPEGSNYSGGCLFNYSCTTPNPGGTGNITNEPMFIAWVSGNFRLKVGSACIDAGNNADAPGIADLDGNARIVNGVVDMGAYEYDGWKYDSDIDGMKDAWETQYGLNPTNSADASIDSDKDGMVNLKEYIADTNPNNDTDYFHIAGISNRPPIVVYFQSSSNRVYSLEGRDDLTTTTFRWSIVGSQSNRWGTGSTMPLSDTNAAITTRFYRIKVNLPPDDSPAPSGMVLIPAGSFQMGDSFNEGLLSEGLPRELPVHSVNVSAFYMDRYEVTKALWDEVANWAAKHGYDISALSGSGKAANHPVHNVSWYECVKWCNARSEKEGLTPCYYTSSVCTTVYRTESINIPIEAVNWNANGYRLPTEAEWEKAARGGASSRRFPWADADTITHSRANYYGYPSVFSYDLGYAGSDTNYAVGGSPYTSPVGSFAANDYGLYDMAGNEWEWCWDWFGADYYASSPSTDPKGPASGWYGCRVERSGCWNSPISYVSRVANRGYGYPYDEYNVNGFRCVRGL